MKKTVGVPYILTLISVVLGFMLALQYQSTQSKKDVESSDFSQLRLNLQRQVENNKILEMNIVKAQNLLHQYKTAGHPVNSSQLMEEELIRLRSLAGLAAVNGSGIRITIEPDIPLDGGLDQNIYDGDIRYLVNELFGAGASAISINHHRLTPSTYIRDVGDSIYIDTKMIRPPYEIRAIGDGAIMESTMKLKGIVEYFSTINSIVTLEKEDSLSLPAYLGEIPIREMRLPKKM